MELNKEQKESVDFVIGVFDGIDREIGSVRCFWDKSGHGIFKIEIRDKNKQVISEETTGDFRDSARIAAKGIIFLEEIDEHNRAIETIYERR